jgi:hypothetical protein
MAVIARWRGFFRPRGVSRQTAAPGSDWYAHRLVTNLMSIHPELLRRCFAAAAGAVVLTALLWPAQNPGADPLAADIARWSSYLTGSTSKHENMAQVKPGALAGLATAQQALAKGERLAALYRLALVRANVAGIAFQLERAGEGSPDAALLDREWERMGTELKEDLAPTAAAALAAIKPAAAGALAEVSLPQVRGFYLASRDFGYATTPETGLYYLGAARSERDFVALARALREPVAGRAPAFRSIAGEIDALNGEMLAAFRPPLSIDRHMEFVVAHAALNDARDLDVAGQHRGALLRYLQAAIRFARLRPTPPSFERKEMLAGMADSRARLGVDGLDHSLAAMLLEVAAGEIASAAADAPTPTAAAIVADALPRYFAALAPALARPPAPAPVLTVTLARWPYT